MSHETRRPRDLEPEESVVFDDWQRRHQPLTARAGACPPPHQIFAVRAGGVPDGEAHPVLQHVSACPLCEALVTALTDGEAGVPGEEAGRRLDRRVRGAIAAGASRRRVLSFPSRWGWWPEAALAAAAMLLAAIVPATWRRSVDLPPVGPPVRQAIAVPSREILVAEHLDTSEMGLASLSWRGDGRNTRPSSEFDVARRLYERGAFREAEQQLQAVTDRTPSFADAWLLLGVSRLLLGDAERALEPLRQARAQLTGVARHDATWHLAVALHAVGRDEEASAVLEPLCSERGVRGAMACVALIELGSP